MAAWQAQEAKARLGKVVEQAVILSAEDYRALVAHKPDFRSYLLGGPKVDEFEIGRDCDKGRKFAL